MEPSNLASRRCPVPSRRHSTMRWSKRPCFSMTASLVPSGETASSCPLVIFRGSPPSTGSSQIHDDRPSSDAANRTDRPSRLSARLLIGCEPLHSSLELPPSNVERRISKESGELCTSQPPVSASTGKVPLTPNCRISLPGGDGIPTSALLDDHRAIAHSRAAAAVAAAAQRPARWRALFRLLSRSAPAAIR